MLRERRECKMVIVVRNDLKMSVGKMCAQVGHGGLLISFRSLLSGLANFTRNCRLVGEGGISKNSAIDRR